LDIILTGIARSGTTLTCSLLNKLPQTVALHEPMNPADLVGLDVSTAFLDRVADFFAAQRASLLASGTAVSLARGGVVPDNPFEPTCAPAGLRPSTVGSESVQFAKQLRTGFRLAIKHPNCFTATLPALLTRYPCYALIRNPLAVLLSWNTIQAPVHDGHLPYAEAFDDALRKALAAEPDRIERQFIILDWYFSRYAELLPPAHVMRYEELVASRGRALAVVDPAAAGLDEPLESRNASSLYDAAQVADLAGRLLDRVAVTRGFYSAAAIETLWRSWPAGGPPASHRPGDGSPGR
jgi:hypothetical protein